MNGAIILPGNAPSLMSVWCNPYGAEDGGARRFLGQDTDSVFHQWHCDNKAVGRFRMECTHGHRGQVMYLCSEHANAFRKRDITFCPRCNIPPQDHKCKLNLTSIS